MSKQEPRIHYPRRRVIRGILRALVHIAFALLADLEIVGRENLPKHGPLLIVGNHFSYIDPAAIIRATPWPVEFLGGFRNPGAPKTVTMFPKLWGIFPVFRGTASRAALRAGETVLAFDGVLVVMPEAGNWATVLRPARPGAAYLATRTGVPLLPIGLDGLTEIFPSLRKGKRAHVTIRIGEPFGPFEANGRGRERREQLDEIGHVIMSHIAELIPPERRGHYSDDPAIRDAAKGTEVYPWAEATEEAFSGGEHLNANAG
jgi:1-acyl-sn-glycerol-3-phosphate acyltransferase